MTRLLALLFFVWTVYQLIDSQVRRLKQQLGSQGGRRTVRPGNHESPVPPRRLGELVPCERCGLHVVRSKAVVKAGKSFCSEQCARHPA